MTPAAIEKYLLSLPGATLSIQWGGERVFKVGGKMFAVLPPKGEKRRGLSFKAGDDSFHILTRVKGIVPAPYLARAHWIRLERCDILAAAELREYLRRAHGLIAARLPRKMQRELGLPV